MDSESEIIMNDLFDMYWDLNYGEKLKDVNGALSDSFKELAHEAFNWGVNGGEESDFDNFFNEYWPLDKRDGVPYVIVEAYKEVAQKAFWYSLLMYYTQDEILIEPDWSSEYELDER